MADEQPDQPDQPDEPTVDGGVGTDNIQIVLRGPDGEIKQEEAQ